MKNEEPDKQDKLASLMKTAELIHRGDTAISKEGHIVSRSTPGAMPYESLNKGEPEPEWRSTCCGAESVEHSRDIGMCPDCKEHCEYELS